MSYPNLTFKREPSEHDWIKSQWAAFYQGERLGAVYSLHTGGWAVVGGVGGYSTRYEAAYSLYTALSRAEARS